MYIHTLEDTTKLGNWTELNWDEGVVVHGRGLLWHLTCIMSICIEGLEASLLIALGGCCCCSNKLKRLSLSHEEFFLVMCVRHR